MSQQNIYQIQLLNDLHNHFPEILYNPGRFRNIQDLLEYIRQVADSSPYTRGQASYNNRQALNARVYNTRQNATHIPTYPPVGPVAGVAPAPPNPNANATWGQPVMTTVFEDNIPTTRIRVPVNTAAAANNVLINTLLGGMFGDLFGAVGGGGDAGLQGFLNQRVPVYPSAQEIDRATTLFRVNRHQDDICAICQDDIDINQEIRQIDHCSHSFHRECIDTWFQGNVHCPTCRHDIREVTDATNNNRNARDNNENINRQENRMNNENINRPPADTNPNNPPPVPDNYRLINIRRSNQ